VAQKQEKLEQLALKYYDRLFRAALFMCNDHQAAEDLVQDTFVAALGSLDSFEGRSSYYTWLYGILLNKFRGYLRGKSNSVVPAAQGDEPDRVGLLDQVSDTRAAPEERMTQHETAQLVREALDELPPHHRGVLALRYLEGMSYREIAVAMDCSVGTVKSRIHYALRKIGHVLERNEDFNDHSEGDWSESD